MIYGLNEMLDLNLNISDMVLLSKKLGSDIPFFFFGGTCHVSGLGENIEKLNNIFIDEFNLNTINLKINDKTKKMYGFIDEENFSKGDKTNDLKKIIMNSNKVSPNDIYNVFFDIAKFNFKEVNNQSIEMKNLFNNCSLSGAGMTLFSISDKHFNFKKYKTVNAGLEVVN